MSWNDWTEIVAPLQIRQFVDVAVAAGDHRGQGAAAQDGDRLYRHAVGADDDRGVADAAADRRVAGADLGRHLGTAAHGDEFDGQPFFLEIAAGIGQVHRREGDQELRRGQQIGHLGQVLRTGPSGRRHGTGGERDPQLSRGPAGRSIGSGSCRSSLRPCSVVAGPPLGPVSAPPARRRDARGPSIPSYTRPSPDSAGGRRDRRRSGKSTGISRMIRPGAGRHDEHPVAERPPPPPDRG